jgi:hypothetical protein
LGKFGKEPRKMLKPKEESLYECFACKFEMYTENAVEKGKIIWLNINQILISTNCSYDVVKTEYLSSLSQHFKECNETWRDPFNEVYLIDRCI